MKTPKKKTAAKKAPVDLTSNGLHQPSVTPAKAAPPMSKREFNAINMRRHRLIDKKFDGGGLTKEEEEELERLQEETEHYLDAVFPLNFAMIEEMKELARKEGISLEGFPE